MPASKRATERMLFITPVMPAFTGNGLAMRAAHNLHAFASRFQVTLLVLAHYRSPAGFRPPSEISALCTAVHHLPVLSGLVAESRPDVRRARAALTGEKFDVVVVFRLTTLAGAVDWFPQRGEERWLDLDDVDSATLRRIGRADESELREIEAGEAEAVSWFDRIFLASGEDARLLPAGRAIVSELPNVIPAITPPDRIRHDRFTLLFVGTLSYPPNDDGVRWFVAEVWSLIQRESRRPVDLLIVGPGASSALQVAAKNASVSLVGPVESVREWYARADTAIVPLRTGGGTRIKAIEAMAFGVPVVSTSIGVEGFPIEQGSNISLADDATGFALAILELMDNAPLASKLTRHGREFAANYTLDRLKALIETL